MCCDVPMAEAALLKVRTDMFAPSGDVGTNISVMFEPIYNNNNKREVNLARRELSGFGLMQKCYCDNQVNLTNEYKFSRILIIHNSNTKISHCIKWPHKMFYHRCNNIISSCMIFNAGFVAACYRANWLKRLTPPTRILEIPVSNPC
jgi:hypothetical protein